MQLLQADTDPILNRLNLSISPPCRNCLSKRRINQLTCALCARGEKDNRLFGYSCGCCGPYQAYTNPHNLSMRAVRRRHMLPGASKQQASEASMWTPWVMSLASCKARAQAEGAAGSWSRTSLEYHPSSTEAVLEQQQRGDTCELDSATLTIC
jgi:hypothetical protein